ncbi:MAG: hypothetical protein QXG09_03400 [Candidatus Bathyarchaeia archaeon]
MSALIPKLLRNHSMRFFSILRDSTITCFTPYSLGVAANSSISLGYVGDKHGMNGESLRTMESPPKLLAALSLSVGGGAWGSIFLASSAFRVDIDTCRMAKPLSTRFSMSFLRVGSWA